MIRHLQARLVHAGEKANLTIRGTINDLLLGELGSRGGVFFFPGRLDAAVLEASLSSALAAFPPFAGRLRSDDFELSIICDDSGARFSVADIDATSANIIATGQYRALVDTLRLRRLFSGSWPVFTARLCRFSDGTSALACAWNHSLGDMHTLAAFMHAWSAAANGEPIAAPLIVAERRAYLAEHLPPDTADGRALWRPVKSSEWARIALMLATERFAPTRLAFSDREITRMRETFGTGLSRNDAIAAHFMTLLHAFSSEKMSRSLSMVVGLRHRLGLDRGYVGNALGSVAVSCAPETSVEALAASIRATTDSYAAQHHGYHSEQAFLAGLGHSENLHRFGIWHYLHRSVDPLHGAISLTNWSGFGLYGVAFCGQTPTFFAPARHEPLPGSALLVEGAGNRGQVLFVTLPVATVAALNHPDNRERVHPFAD